MKLLGLGELKIEATRFNLTDDLFHMELEASKIEDFGFVLTKLINFFLLGITATLNYRGRLQGQGKV